MMRKLDGSKWSPSMKCWYIPNEKSHIAILVKHLTDWQIPFENKINDPSEKEKTDTDMTENSENRNVEVEITSKTIFIKLPKNETDIQFIRSFKFARWNSGSFRWIVPNYKNNLELLQSYFPAESYR